MTSIEIQKYFPAVRPLQHLIKYFWAFDSGRPMVLDHKILPTNNIDIIFNFKAPMAYEKDGTVQQTPGDVYFSGHFSSHSIMKQEGVIQTIGVSFFPAGLYPFFGIPVSEFRNAVVGLDTLLSKAAVELEEKLRTIESVCGRVRLLERFFLNLLKKSTPLPEDTARLLNRFYCSGNGVAAFCKEHGVHPRTLERVFNMFVGISPKQFRRLTRFQNILSELLKGPATDLTDLAHAFDYFDQAHFIKDFRAFTGTSPSKFLNEKRSLRQIMK